MKPDEKWFRDLGRRARLDGPPPIDVSPAVTAAIRKRPSVSYDPLSIIAGTSAAAAAVVLAHAIQMWWQAQDPFTSLMASMNMVMQ